MGRPKILSLANFYDENLRRLILVKNSYNAVEGAKLIS